MASTYTLNNGIELIGTGEQSGTWGDTTNTNLSLVDTALDGQVTVTLPSAGTSGSPNTLAISDGAASDGRNRMVIFNDGGDLGATAYVQLTPNDAEKIIYVRNDLAGSRSIILFKGTYNASNDYELPAGTTAVIYFDGAGSGAVAANVFNNAYFDSLRLGSVSVTEIIDDDTMATAAATNIATSESIKAYVDAQVGANNELSEVLANGNTSGGTAIQMTTTDELQFRDTALKISSSADGQLDIDADTEIEIVAPTVDIDASTAMTIDTAALTVTGAVDLNTSLNVDGTITSDGLTVDGSGTAINIQSNNSAGTARNALRFTDLDGSASASQQLGKIEFYSSDASAPGAGVKAEIVGIAEVGNPGAALQFKTDAQSGTPLERMRIDRFGDITFYDTSGNASFVYDESAGSTFNENGDNKDFRVESDTQTHMLFVDASTNRVGIGEDGPLSRFHLKMGGTSRSDGLFITRTDNDNHQLGLWTSGGVMYYDAFTDNASSSGQFRLRHSRDTGSTTTESIFANDTNVVINDGSADMDFRVESDVSTVAFYINGQNGYIGLGESSPESSLHVSGSGSVGWFYLNNTSPTADHVMYFRRQNANVAYLGLLSTDQFWLNGSDASKVVLAPKAGTELVVNESSVDADFRVEGDTNANALFVDGATSTVSIGGAIPSSYQLNVVNNQRITGNTASLLLLATNNSVGSHVGAVDVQTHPARGSHIALTDSDGREYGIKRDYSSGSDITRAIIYADDGTTQRRIMDWGVSGNYAVFNEEGNDMDFRVESDTNANMLFVDAGNDVVKIGTAGTNWNTVTPVQIGSGAVSSYGVTNNILLASNWYYESADKYVNSDEAASYKQEGGNHYFLTAPAGTAGGAMTLTERFRIDLDGNTVVNDVSSSTGDFRVEGNSFSHLLHVSDNTFKINANANGATGGWTFYPTGSGDSPYAVVNKTTSGSTRAWAFQVSSSTKGSIDWDSTGVQFNTTSDRRLKDNIEPIADGTEKLMAMKPVTHTWKAEPEADAVHGFIAQEMMGVVPEAVSGDPDGDEMMGMDYGRITPVLVAALQDAITKIETLEARIAALENA